MNEQKYTNNQDIEVVDERLKYEIEQALLRRQFEKPSVEDEWLKFVQQEEKYEIEKSKRRAALKRRFMIGVSTAAAILIGVFVFYNIDMHKKEDTILIYAAQKMDAPIILEEQSKDSEIINKTVIASNAPKIVKKGVIVSPDMADYTSVEDKDVETSVITIPHGQVYKIILNDGTEVWMNANSKLTFPTQFIEDERVVTLQGEAYFKVTKNEKKPFIIKTNKIDTRVLGTELNVKAFEDSDVHVTLISGAIKVYIPEIQKEISLSPGEDIGYTNNIYQVNKINTDYYTQWKEGYFYFDNASLADILKELGYWYNMTVEMEQDTLLTNLRLHFIADRKEKINQVIENLNAFDYLNAYQKGGKLIVELKK